MKRPRNGIALKLGIYYLFKITNVISQPTFLIFEEELRHRLPRRGRVNNVCV